MWCASEVFVRLTGMKQKDVQVRHTLYIGSGVFLTTAFQIQGTKVDQQRTEHRRPYEW